jgi:hypothetical protein
MSRLSDLLNPAPSTQSTPQPIDVNAAEASHGRNASITSPLEALAIAATTQSPPISSFGQPTSDPLSPISHSHHPFTIPAPTLPSLHSAATSQQSSVKQEPEMSSHAPSVTSAKQETANNASEQTVAREPSEVISPPVQAGSDGAEARTDTSNRPLVPAIVTEVKKEPETNPPTPSVQSPTVLPTTEDKKRSAPKPSKKGTASVIRKPASKKRKIEAPSKDGTPMSQRSGTPNSSRASKTPAPKSRKRNSATPVQSSPPRSIGGDEDDDDDDGQLFCICRKPDDHKWMIGCDGGCDDWFHGRCVNMKEEDAELIDQYICKRSRPVCRSWLKHCRSKLHQERYWSHNLEANV